MEGRSVIVTGGSRGIGLGIAGRIVAEGGRVCLTARKADDLAAAAGELGPADRVVHVAGNVDDADHQEEVVAVTLDAFGKIDGLVNNAGTNPWFGPIVELDDEVSRKVFEVNVLAAIAMTRRAWHAQGGLRQSGGSVLNVSSLASLAPAPGIGIYGASKAMLSYITTELAVELAPSVRVNGVAPGVVKTRFARALYEDREDEVAARYPLARLGDPEDVASAAVFLLSDDASWITGQTIVLDGGLSLVGNEP